MDALLSAPAGVALLIDGSELSSIDVGFPGRRTPRRAEEVHLLFGEGNELQLLQNVNLGQVSRRLEQEVDAAEALQLALIVLDPEASVDIRQGAAVELDNLLARDGCRERLERVLYSHPLPADGDLDGALSHSEGHAPATHLLLRNFEALQPVISEVRSAWVGIPDRLFESAADRRRFQAAAVREGLFRDLVLVRRSGDSLNSFLMKELRPIGLATQGNHNLLSAWIAPLRQPNEKRARAAAIAVPRRSVTRHRYATQVEDTAVVAGFLSGDARTVGAVDGWISRAAYPYQRRLGEQWDDVLQDIRLEITRLLKQGKFRGESSFKTYLWRVVSHTCLDQIRAAGRVQWAELETDSGAEDSAGPFTPPSAAVNAAARSEVKDLLLRILERVPADCRDLWRMIHAGLSYREISDRLGVPEGTVRVRVLRCREKAVAARSELVSEA